MTFTFSRRPMRTMARRPGIFIPLALLFLMTASLDLLLPVRLFGVMTVVAGVESLLDGEFDLVVMGIGEPIPVVRGLFGRVLASITMVVGAGMVIIPAELFGIFR